ncbi:hypothetical protein ACJMK2_034570 [Sinanodonta woodiana]|uniref:Graves disease carrier protein n=1 Tax=Sinanodonta woodiana TaxID=1069815 RepID=A0ABD3WS08_SINWO
MSSTNHQKQLETVLKTLCAGGIAGCCAKTTVAPLDRIKILLQGHKQHFKHLGVFSSLKQVKQKEGFLGFYRGNGVQMVRIFPYASIQFFSYEQYKKIFKLLTSQPHPHMDKLVSGSMAGLTAVLCTYPLDMVRARLAFQTKGEYIHDGLVGTVKAIVTLEGGPKALFRGIVPSLLGMAPYAGISFFTFESLKTFCLDTFPENLGKPCSSNTGGLVLILPAKLLCGGLAGAVAQTLSYPLDVVRRRIQLASMLPESHKYTGSWYKILMVIYKEDGIVKGLFRGMSVNYIRAMPMVAVSFSTYEMTKQFLGLDTGVDR